MSRHNIMKSLLVMSMFLTWSCSAANYEAVDMEYVTNSFSISKIGVCGPLSTEAATEFMYAGYLVEDLGSDVLESMGDVPDKGFYFMAIAGKIAYDEPDPSGFSSYALRVVDLKTGETLWSSEGEYQTLKALIREKRPLSQVFRDMVSDFAKTYPPEQNSK